MKKRAKSTRGVVRTTHYDHVRRELVDVTDAGVVPRRTEGATIGERPELALRDLGSRIDADGQGDGA